MTGAIASITLVAIPVAQATPASTAQIWHGLFNRGHAIMPKLAVTVAATCAYAAYDSYSNRGYWKGFLGAAGLTIAIVPFTLLFINSVNATLMHAAKGSSTLTVTQISELASKWGLLNLVRSFLPMAGAVTGLIALLDNSS
jgi:hypothetical protein